MEQSQLDSLQDRLKQINYPYYDSKTKGFDYMATIDCLLKAKLDSIVLLHVYAHNLTGVDPTETEQQQIAEVCKTKIYYHFLICLSTICQWMH
ncbi:unnamed protein product [Paramecium octaurelia]|uniref:Aminotransferase class I/classII large domain-containing protein n=1 Tax=Paramecium octaurelia TaxID=43137 RepID=A0A8S1UVL4_PAROT|nr:unnamed protein product [Paramecium octaurelia]